MKARTNKVTIPPSPKPLGIYAAGSSAQNRQISDTLPLYSAIDCILAQPPGDTTMFNFDTLCTTTNHILSSMKSFFIYVALPHELHVKLHSVLGELSLLKNSISVSSHSLQS